MNGDLLEQQAIGFTGTQEGCQSNQLATLAIWLDRLRERGFVWMRNGDCVGADEQAGDAWKGMGGKLILHPPTINAKRAFMVHDLALAPLPYLERNRAIVDGSALLVATPVQMTEQRRGGTWSTIRYADRRGKPHLIVYPDGSYAGRNGFAGAPNA